MVLSTSKVRAVEGFTFDAVTVNGKVCAVATVPADGFQRLVAYHCLPSGQWAWVHKNFRK
jgi:hypothetical protein